MDPRIAHAIARIAHHHPTPFYLYDETCMRGRVASVQGDFRPHTLLFYSMKANPNLGIVERLSEVVDGIEVGSGGELSAILGRGVAADRIIFVGPAKGQCDLERAIAEGILAIVVESPGELRLIESLCERMQRGVRVMLRINPSFSPDGFFLNMTGRPSQFGIDEEQVPEQIASIQNSMYVRLVGFHCYLGSRELSATRLINSVRQTLEVFGSLAELLPTDQRLYFDIGGGFGVTYFPDETPLDIAAAAQAYRTELRGLRDRLGSRAQVIIELGSYLVAESGYYACRVLYDKRSRGQRFVVTDGGMHHNLSNNSRSLWDHKDTRAHFPLSVIPRGHFNAHTPKGSEAVRVVGPLCTPADVVSRNKPLDGVEPGDILVVEKSGAYGLTDSPVLFLSHAMPDEYLLGVDGRVHLIRARVDGSELLAPTGLLGCVPEEKDPYA